jgi:hypothetical protein
MRVARTYRQLRALDEPVGRHAPFGMRGRDRCAGCVRLSGRNDARSSPTGSVVGLHHSLRLLVDLQMCSQRMTTNWLGGQRSSTEGFGPR